MRHRDFIILKKIINEIDIASEMMEEITLSRFLEDEKLKRAVSMTVINIGELIKNVTDDLRNEHKEIPWKAVAGMRDITAHKYQTLRMEDVYNTATTDLPELKQQLITIIDEK